MRVAVRLRRLASAAIVAVAFCLSAALRPHAAVAANTTCTASYTTPVFATYYPLSANLTTADASTTAGAIALSCSGNKSGYLTISTGTPTLAGPSPSLAYSIYEPGSSSTLWTTGYQAPFNTQGGSATVNYNASITAGQAVKSGSYADTSTTFSYSFNGGALTALPSPTTTASVAAECVFSNATATTVNFSTPYQPIGTNGPSGSDETQTWQALYECTQSDSTYKIAFASANANGTQMRMASGSKFLNYYVHDTAAANFPSGTAELATGEPTGAGYNQLAYTFTFGIPKGQNPGNGTYSDSNVVTLTP